MPREEQLSLFGKDEETVLDSSILLFRGKVKEAGLQLEDIKSAEVRQVEHRQVDYRLLAEELERPFG